MSRLYKQINFILEIDKFKSIYRQTKIINKSRKENDAEHSWHLCVMACILLEYSCFTNLDLLKIVKMLLIHDLAEIVDGDVYTFDIEAKKEKKLKEKESIEKIFSLLPDDQMLEYRELWDEFNSLYSPESKYAVAIDKLQPFFMDVFTNGETWIYGSVTKKQMMNYLEIVKEVFPALWDYILNKIDDAVVDEFLIGD